MAIVVIGLRPLAARPWLCLVASVQLASAGWISPVRAGEVVEVPRTLGPSTRQEIALATSDAPGTIIVSAKDYTLDFIVGKVRAIRYRIGVGRDGFGWTGVMTVGAKTTWP